MQLLPKSGDANLMQSPTVCCRRSCLAFFVASVCQSSFRSFRCVGGTGSEPLFCTAHSGVGCCVCRLHFDHDAQCHQLPKDFSIRSGISMSPNCKQCCELRRWLCGDGHIRVTAAGRYNARCSEILHATLGAHSRFRLS